MAKRFAILCGALAVPLVLSMAGNAGGRLASKSQAGVPAAVLLHASPAVLTPSATAPCDQLAAAKTLRNTLEKELKGEKAKTLRKALKKRIRHLNKKIKRLKKACAASKIPPPPADANALDGSVGCSQSGPPDDDEDECDASSHHRRHPNFGAFFAAADVFDTLKVIVVGPAPRQITNMLCPTQLPNPAITTTTNTNDTLLCSGGSLPADQPYKFNIRLNGTPAGDSVQIFEGIAGKFYGPLTAALH